ncbi:HipA domain-containing protein [Adlercreutzia sp. ZJ242]|uniref:HipA domain-containing protein n=1 Tax=Adlercreutzia sp. ZJ242 TaxID=2709409 RepID=UPI0013EDBE55|nr:HipA domain-containing protein [Adlercreutzia sp. ZJ242]
MSSLSVWREYRGSLELVGSISSSSGSIEFAYDPSYEGQPISVALPVRRAPYSEAATARFFGALIPEGTARLEFARILHAERGEYAPFLERLNDESIGAILFSTGEGDPHRTATYEPVEPRFFETFARRPLETAVAVMGKTRLSLSGAMAKVGLYCDAASGRWFYPMGSAPSTHIVKAADGARFPRETVNEALCLGVARRCGLPTAHCSLIDCGEDEPLLAVKRFDRIIENGASDIDGLLVPRRLHQEDFCQAASVALKYEPTDGRYLSLLADTAHRHCANAFGEKSLLLEYTFFHYLVGNCDNHLKNYSLLYDAEWRTQEVAPLYDVASTVLYPEIYLEMGVSFGGDRRIDHVTRDAVERAAASCGVPLRLAMDSFDELARMIPGALEEEADALVRQGFPEARKVSAAIIEGVIQRASVNAR